jgi:hypothetical protein
MRIGFDFDNTIVSYDKLFYQVAIEQSLVPADVPRSKLAVRNYLRNIGQENLWTELQGYVYGARMDDAGAYPDAIEFMELANANGIAMVIVSHKTKHPFMGPKYDLHAAARGWIENNLIDGVKRLVEPEQVFFELTKEEKIARITQCQCDYYIDDLPEILSMSGFPENAGRILFDPENNHESEEVGTRLKSWQEIRTFFEMKWKPCN